MKRYKILLLLVLAFASCAEPEQANNEESTSSTAQIQVELTDAQMNNAAIKTNQIKVHPIGDEIQLNGFIEAPPQNVISISAPLGGFIKSTTMLQGMHVHKGDIIAELEHSDYVQLQESFLSVKEELRMARLDAERQATLLSGNAASDKTAQEAASKVTQLEIRKQSLSEKLSMCGIDPSALNPNTISRRIILRSPANAYVKSVAMNIGKYMTPQDVLIELIDTDHLHVELTAYEKDARFIKEGQAIQFAFVNTPDVFHRASVHLVGRAINSERSLTVHGHIEGESTNFIPGESVQAIIEAGADSVPAIENSAIVMFNGLEHVFISTGKNKFTLAPIKRLKKGESYSSIQFADNRKSSEAMIVVEGAHNLLAMLLNTEE